MRRWIRTRVCPIDDTSPCIGHPFLKQSAASQARWLAVYTQRMTYLERICRALDEAGVHYAPVGGYAVALYGAPCGTIDMALRCVGALMNSLARNKR